MRTNTEENEFAEEEYEDLEIEEEEEDESDEEDDDEEEELDIEPNQTQETKTLTTVPILQAPPPPPPPPPEDKKPSTIDDSRRLFQRLWTDEDEIGLLQGFLDFTTQRGGFKNSAYHHDTAPFYDQIKTRLQLDFNKNQLVEKLRRLKKKYRNAMNRISSGREIVFKTVHDQATFEISKKIWGESGIEDEEGNAAAPYDGNGAVDGEKKVSLLGSRSRKRKRVTSGEENVKEVVKLPVNSNVIEETVRSCLSPLIKELVSNSSGSRGGLGFGGMGLSPLPLSLGGNTGEVIDEKWRKQQILELEVYAKRMELVQEQIKLGLEELRSAGGR